jgi:hypothetical protein
LKVAGNLTITNGTGYETEHFMDLNVGGAFYVRNGDGGSFLTINRSTTGVSTIGGAMTVVNGVGMDETRVFDLNVGGSVSVQNGLANAPGTAGSTEFLNQKNTTFRSQIRGSLSVMFTNGSAIATLADAEVGGDVTFGYGTGTGNTTLDTYATALAPIVRGSLTISGTGAQRVFLGISMPETGLMVGGRLTVLGGPGADLVNLGHVQVGGATALYLGDGNNTARIDDSLFAGAFSLITGAGADAIFVDTVAGTTAATTFKGPVSISEGAGSDSLTLAGPNDAGQAIVALGTFVVHHGTGSDTFYPSNDHLFFPFGTSLVYVV